MGIVFRWILVKTQMGFGLFDRKRDFFSSSQKLDCSVDSWKILKKKKEEIRVIGKSNYGKLNKICFCKRAKVKRGGEG